MGAPLSQQTKLFMEKTDLIIPMVFDSDPLWQLDFRRLNRTYHASDFDAARWRSWGTEHLLVKAIRKFMPWISTIHILLARESQIQDWMWKEDVHVVFHKDFIPKRFLPTFNANTIEMFLHEIPGLSDRFIYGNDDMYPLAYLPPEYFFDDGKPCQKYIRCKYPEKPNTFQRFCMNGLNMIAADFGQHFTDTWMVSGHGFSPFLKSTCEKVWELHGEQILSSITADRTPTNYNQYIYGYYQHFSGQYSKNIPPHVTLSVAFPPQEIERIMNKGFGVVCVNDHEGGIDFEEYRTTVYNALERKITAN